MCHLRFEVPERASPPNAWLHHTLMKRLLFALLLSASLSLTLASRAVAEPEPTKADIVKLMAEAATYAPGQSREPFRGIEELVRQSSPRVRKQLEAGLVKLLGPGSTFEARRFACKQLGIIGSKRALPALAKLLPSDETAGMACLALTTYPPGKADAILRSALPSARGSARIQIITTLGDRKDSRAVTLLAQSASDTNLSVAQAAIAALGKVGDQAAWKAIVARSADADPALQPALTEAALRCAEARAAAGDAKAATALYDDLFAPSQPAYIRRAVFEAVLRLDKTQAQARILAVLHGSDSTLRPAAIAYVRALPSHSASDVFAAELPDLSSREQVWMIDSLAARGDATACAAIGNSLASPEPAVRRAAISALGRMGNAWCVALFAPALNRSKDAEEQRAIESALIGLPGGAQTDQAIVGAMKESSGNTRATLITALARRQGPAANRLLLAEAKESQPTVAKAALRALAKTAANRDLTPLLEVLTSTHNAEIRSEAQNAAAQAISRSEDSARCSATVRNALGWAQGIDSSIALLGLLPACDDAAALAALQSATTDSDFRIRDAAVRALADWPDISGWDALAGIYHMPRTETLRGLALRGLVRLASEANADPDARLVKRYQQLLAEAHGDAELRLILGALGGDPQPGALDLALPLLDNSGVRAEAEVAVKKIAEAIKAQHPRAAQEALSRLQRKAGKE